jgi:hypothetical protein
MQKPDRLESSKFDRSTLTIKSVALWALIALNAVLLVMFVSRMTKPNIAAAQVGRPGDYLMIPGSVVGGVNDVVYILDQNSHQLSAMSYDPSSNGLVTMKPPRDLDRDFDASGTGRRR